MEIIEDSLFPVGIKSQIAIPSKYQELLTAIFEIYTQGQINAVQSVNVHLLQTYWRIGRHIVDFEPGGSINAEYGKALYI